MILDWDTKSDGLVTHFKGVTINIEYEKDYERSFRYSHNIPPLSPKWRVLFSNGCAPSRSFQYLKDAKYYAESNLMTDDELAIKEIIE